MSQQAQLNNARLLELMSLLGNNQGAMYLGPGTTGRLNYTDTLVPEKILNTKAGEPILEENQQVLGNTVIGKEAPTRLWDRISAGVQDWWDPTKDRDMRSGVWIKDPEVPGSQGMYSKVDTETGYGGQVELEPVLVDNPEADPSKNTVLGKVGKWAKNFPTQFAQDAYSGWRDNRLLNTRLAQASNYLKDANKFAYELDKAQMYDFMNSPMGQAKTSLLTQQAFATPRLAKAALKEAVARQQSAANEFGQLGTRRTYFTG